MAVPTSADLVPAPTCAVVRGATSWVQTARHVSHMVSGEHSRTERWGLLSVSS